MRERHMLSQPGKKGEIKTKQIKQTGSWRRRCESCRFKVKGQLAGGGAKVCSSGCTASCCKTDHSELKRHQKFFQFDISGRTTMEEHRLARQIHKHIQCSFSTVALAVWQRGTFCGTVNSFNFYWSPSKNDPKIQNPVFMFLNYSCVRCQRSFNCNNNNND